MTEPTAAELHAEDLIHIQRLRLMDDDFMKICFRDNIPAVEYVLRILLEKPALRVETLAVEDVIPNLHGHGVRLDIHARDTDGREYDIEVQRSDQGASSKRARYNSSLLDAAALPSGKDYRALPETYVIFITENDIFACGEPLYHIERTIREAEHRLFGDQAHILFANGAFRGKNAIGQLMRDMNESNPAKMASSPLKDTVQRFKNTEEGVSTMCRELEKMRTDAEKRGKARGVMETTMRIIRNMLTRKTPYAEIAATTDTTVEEVKRIARESGLAY